MGMGGSPQHSPDNPVGRAYMGRQKNMEVMTVKLSSLVGSDWLWVSCFLIPPIYPVKTGPKLFSSECFMNGET